MTTSPLARAGADAPAAPRWRDLARTRAVLAVVAVELLVAASVAYGLWALRQQTLGSELRMLGSLAAAMAAQADGTLDVADAVLRATRTELVDGLLQPGTDAARALLRARAAALPRFRALTVIDAQGRRLATSRDEAMPASSVAERDYFVAARKRSGGGLDDALFVGSPYVDGAGGQPAIGVAMDWRGADGAFKGVVVLLAEPEFLDGGFERIAPTPDTGLAIYRRDRELVSDGPGDGVARLLPASVMDRLWADAEPEAPRLTTLPDGRQRLVAAHRLQRYPLMVVVTRDAGVVLAEWSDQAWLVGSFAASALAMTLLLTLRNSREQALRRASETTLAAEQARAVRAFQAAEEGHWEWNPLTGQSHLSPRMKELLGMQRDEPVDAPVGQAGLLARSALHPDDLGPLQQAFTAHQQGRTPVFDCTFRVRQADGRWHQVRARGHAWRDAAGSPVLFSGTASDVTAEVEARARRQQLEDQLQRARKLEALGTLAGGVAHDFNNILAAVIGYGEMARGSAADGSSQARQLDQVLQAGQRGRALVERILSLSRGTPRSHTPFRLQPVIDEMLQLLAASLPAQVQLERRLQAPDAVISGTATMVYEAAMNLCVNAMQALQDSAGGGRIVVELTALDLSASLAMFEGRLAPGRYVCLSVSDNGPGITPDVKARLFEPFFTTKGQHQGTGLGLAVVHGVMHDLGGAIDLQSEPGRGSRFCLYFPCIDEAPAAQAAVEPVLPPGHGRSVMVVDDEPALVALAEEMLAGLGYEPIGFGSGTQALAAFQSDPDRFDLVLTDQQMPDMAGTALAGALHDLRPALPIVLVSGYGGPRWEARAAAAGITVRVRKPLTRTQLAQALDQAWQQAATGAA